MSLTAYTEPADEPAVDIDVDERSTTSNRTRIRLFDGTEFIVTVTQRDLVQWDLTAPKHKWGKATDVPFLCQTFTAFAAAKREGHIEGMKWETFRESIEVLEEAPEADVIRPTSPARSLGLS